MKKTVWLLIVIAIAFSSCRKLTEFKINNSTTFVVPQTATVGLPVLDTNQVATSSTFQFEANGTDAKHVKEVKLDRMVLTITNPANQNFDFLSSIHLSIYADGLPEVEIAYLDNITDNVGNSIDLLTTGVVLDEYIKKDSYNLKIKTVTDKLLSQDIAIKADMTFFVKAKLI